MLKKSKKSKSGIFRTEYIGKKAFDIQSGVLCQGDAVEFLTSLSDEIADIVFLDPPFNLGKDYGLKAAHDKDDPAEYAKFLCRVVSESSRVLKPGGALFLYHLPYWATRIAPTLNRRLTFRHWIAVSMKNGFVRGDRLYPAHYALLYFTKGEPGTFKRPRLRPKRCRHCDNLIKDYGGYTKIITKKGLNLSDFWDDISPVRHAKHKKRGANELPLLLTSRVTAIAGKRHGVLVDPFVGTGASLEAAIDAGMHYVGNDLVSKNLAICFRRLAEKQELRRKDAKTMKIRRTASASKKK